MNSIFQTSGTLLVSVLVFCQSALQAGTITTSVAPPFDPPSPPPYGTTGGDGTFPDGSNCTVIATPASGYRFARWTESGFEASTSASYTFTVNGDRDLLAEFEVSLPELLGGEVTPGTVYSFRAYAINSVGIGYSNSGTFTTPGGATVTAPTAVSVPGDNTKYTLGGTVSGAGISARGVVYSPTALNPDPLIGDENKNVIRITTSDTAGAFAVSATGLTPGTAYNFKAFATNGVGTRYGAVTNFTPGGPTVASPTSTGISGPGATLGGNVTNAGGSTIIERGVVYAPTATNPNPLIDGDPEKVIIVPAIGTTTGTFTAPAITGLAPGTGYTFRAYATTTGGTGYSAAGSFTTAGGPTLAATPSSASVVDTSATLGGNVTNANGSAIAVRGVVFAPTATNPNPQIGGTGVTHVPGTGTTTGAFTVDVGGIIAKVTGTTATLKARWIPHTPPNNTTFTSFNKKLATVTVYGPGDEVEGNPREIPRPGVLSSVPVTVTATIKGLARGQKYNWRAFAGGGDNGTTNTSRPETYSNPALTTLEPQNLAPSIGTVTAGTVTATTAVITVPLTPNDNQDLNNQNTNSTVVVYGPDTNYGMSTLSQTVPIVVDQNTGDSNAFVETSLGFSLSNLQPGKTYHYKVIANNADTLFNASSNPDPAPPAESPDQTFTTLPSNPTVTTPTFASVSTSTVTLGGNVISDGGSIVTARGVVFAPSATNPNPQLSGTGVTIAPGMGTTGVFTVNATGLTPGTAYTFKAYATNSVGTSYSTTGSFTTLGLTGREAWRQTHFGSPNNSGDAADFADPNLNGIVNLLEYTLGGNPVNAAAGLEILPEFGESPTGKLRLSFTRYLDHNDLVLTVQAADSPSGPWQGLARSANGGPFVLLEPNAEVVETGTGNARAVAVSDRFLMDDPAHPKRFIRLEVSQ